MKTYLLGSSLLAAVMLSACGGKFQATSLSDVTQGSSSDSQSAADGSQTATMSQKVLQDIGTGLRQKSIASLAGISLSNAQIQALLNAGAAAVVANGLGNSTNINALTPVIVQGITQALSGQVSGNSTQMANLISAIGTAALDAVLKQNTGVLSNALVKEIATKLFQNISAGGIDKAALSDVSGILMSSLVNHLSQKGYQTPQLTTLLSSLSSGAVLGVGNLNLKALGLAALNDILKNIGAGSVQGLTGLNSSSDILQALISAMTSGSQTGLNQVLGANTTLGATLNQLLSSVISGQSANLGSLPISSLKQQLISAVLQLILSKI
jgi:hypothetical protein